MALHADILALAAPVEADIVIFQGDSRVRLRTLRKRNSDGSYTPYDITGWTFRLQVRATFAAASPTISATVAPTANAAQGEFSETWSATDTAALGGGGSSDGDVDIGFYDLDVSDGTNFVTLKRGKVTLRKQVSKT